MKISFLIIYSLFICLNINADSLSERLSNLIKSANIENRNILELYKSSLTSLDSTGFSLTSLDSNGLAFLNKVVNFYEYSNKIKMDTSVYTVGDIDGDGNKDTIYQKIYYKNDTIFIKAQWRKNNNIIWRYSMVNPYLYIDGSDLFNTNKHKRDKWTRYYIAVNNKAVELHERPKNEGDLIIKYGLQDINKYDKTTTEERYKIYLRQFKGLLLSFGDPEIRHTLYIWYKPLRKFILYYAP